MEAAGRRAFLNDDPSYCSLLEGGLEGKGELGYFWGAFCCSFVFSASLSNNDRMYDIQQG